MSAQEPAPSEEPPPSQVRPEDGPRLVRGVDFVVDPDGDTSRVERPVVALCRCGGTGRPPWCDGTHKVLNRRRSGRT